MSNDTRLWLETAHLGGLRVGGWAWVLQAGGEVTGVAGGDRRIDAGRTALAALLAALKATPGDGPVLVRTRSPMLAGAAQTIATAKAGGDAPATDLDLWAQLDTALAARPVRIERVPPQPGTPTAFAAAWAELARDKAKNGSFSAAIPKTNLAKVQGL